MLRTLIHFRLLPMMAVVIFGAVASRAEMQFVGVLSGVGGDFFAIRPASGQPAQWVSSGDHVNGFVVGPYDSKNETLALNREGETLTLRLPTAKVQPLVRDEILAGMSKVLNIPDASTVLDLIHPKLRAKFRDANVSAEELEDITRPEVGRGVRALTAEESKLLGEALSEIEKAVGERPTHVFWIRTARSFSMTFVVQSGGSWYLTPSANPGVPDLSKHQPPPPPN